MSQFDPIIGSDKSGLAYRQEDNQGKKALLNHHKGSEEPTYAEAGTLWVDDSQSPWKMKFFDGTQWFEQGDLDHVAHKYTPYFDGAPLAAATESRAGLVQKANSADIEEGTDNERYVTPAQLSDVATAIGTGKVLEVEVTESVTFIEIMNIFEEDKHYLVRLENFRPHVNNASLRMRFGDETAINTATNYGCICAGRDYSGNISTNDSGMKSSILLAASVGNNASHNYNLHGEIKFFDPARQDRKSIAHYEVTNIQGNGSAIHMSGSVQYYYSSLGIGHIKSLRFYFDSGQIAQGKITIFEV